MIEILLGAFIVIITVTITQFLQYFFTTKTEKNKIKTENILKAKRVLAELFFHLANLNSYFFKEDRHITPDEKLKFNDSTLKIIKEITETIATLSTFHSTKNLSNTLDELFDTFLSLTISIYRKTANATKPLKQEDIKDMKEKSISLQYYANILLRKIP